MTLGLILRSKKNIVGNPSQLFPSHPSCGYFLKGSATTWSVQMVVLFTFFYFCTCTSLVMAHGVLSLSRFHVTVVALLSVLDGDDCETFENPSLEARSSGILPKYHSYLFMVVWFPERRHGSSRPGCVCISVRISFPHVHRRVVSKTATRFFSTWCVCIFLHYL